MKHTLLRRVITGFTLLLLFFTQPKTLANVKNSDSLSAVIDQKMKDNMTDYNLPGAVISIVENDKIIFSQGYGYQDQKTKTPINPNTSMFRIASTTKLFTWTAVMQLVEAGKIDLDADVNTYLTSLKLPATFKKPITMRHLMTHTAGFEEGGVGYQITLDETTLPASISETLKKHELARIRPPGEAPSYSNYGAALAGLIIEDITGQSYGDYLTTNIFKPLKMNHTTVVEPLPQSYQGNQVLGYNYIDKQFQQGVPTYEGGFAPAGAGTASANDMANFMIAHLNGGKFGNQSLMQSKTLELMHQTAFRFDERLPGSALGFQEGVINKQKVISHAGADPVFITNLYLIPDKNIGIFLSYSGGDADAALRATVDTFFNKLFPLSQTEKTTFLPVSQKELKNLAGSYKFTRRNFSHIDKFFSLLTELTVVKENDYLALGQGAEKVLFGKIADNLYQDINGQQKIAFKTDKNGKPTAMLLDLITDMPLERTKTLDKMMFWLPLVGFSALIFLLTILIYLFTIKSYKSLSKTSKFAKNIALITASLSLTTILLTVTQVMNMNVLQRLSAVSLQLKLFLVLPLLTTGLTVALGFLLVKVWRQSLFSLLGRLGFTTLFGASLILSSFFYYWNLLGWNFG